MATVPAFLVYYTTLRSPSASRRATRYAIVGLVLVAVIVAADLQLSYRQSGDLEQPARLRIEDNDFFTFTAYAMAIQEKSDSFTGDSILVTLATGPIPRTWWAGKPYPQSIVDFSLYVWGRDVTVSGGNTLPSIVGQKYMSQGVRGVIEIAAVLGLLFALGDAIFRKATLSARIVYAVIAMYVFVSFRVMAFGFFTVVLFVAGAALLARFITGNRRSPVRQYPQSSIPLGYELETRA